MVLTHAASGRYWETWRTQSSRTSGELAAQTVDSQTAAGVTVFTDDAAARLIETSTNMGSTGTFQNLYDESGAIVQSIADGTDRFGNTSHSSTQYHYAGGRLVSVDGFFGSWDGGGAGHTEFTYDAGGNNVARISTDAAGNVIERWIGVYDAGNNISCESETAAGQSGNVYVRTYDYSCF